MKEDRIGFRFTEDEPIPMIRDFMAFMNYIEGNIPIKLSGKMGNLPYNHLVALNELMSNPNRENTPKTPQKFYPQLNLFYILALAGGLIDKVPKGSSAVLETTERFIDFYSLSDAGKYFFLLETLWLDCRIPEISFDSGLRFGSFEAVYFWNDILNLLSKSKPGQKKSLQQFTIFGLTNGLLTISLPFFGWYDIIRDRESESTKSYIRIKSLIPTPLGVAISKILLNERPFTLWNLHYRKSMGEVVDYPGQDPDDKSKGDYVPFIEAFRKICEDGESLDALPREKRKIIEGNFIFKVSLGGDLWRIIGLNGDDTLQDLHDSIQDAFRFDDDHLYAFYMDNRKWSEYSFSDPRSEDGPFADEIKIRDLDLRVNQQFIYLFDFGDEWTFDVKLIEIQTDKPLLLKPKIIKKKGRSPQQYPNWDDF